MTRDVLQDMLRQQPFEPIEIILATGEKYVIAHPELAAIGRTQMLLVPPDNDSQNQHVVVRAIRQKPPHVTSEQSL